MDKCRFKFLRAVFPHLKIFNSNQMSAFFVKMMIPVLADELLTSSTSNEIGLTKAKADVFDVMNINTDAQEFLSKGPYADVVDLRAAASVYGITGHDLEVMAKVPGTFMCDKIEKMRRKYAFARRVHRLEDRTKEELWLSKSNACFKRKSKGLMLMTLKFKGSPRTSSDHYHAWFAISLKLQHHMRDGFVAYAPEKKVKWSGDGSMDVLNTREHRIVTHAEIRVLCKAWTDATYTERARIHFMCERNITTTVRMAAVYMEIAIGEERVGNMEFALYPDVAPKTCENFARLCDGKNPKGLAFKESIFHRVIPGFMAQGGDMTRGDGTGGESIYGGNFEDESFSKRHDGRGVLSMANCGRNTNGSQFFVLFNRAPHLDGKHVVFGKLIKGFEVLDRIERVRTRPSDDRPTQQVKVIACGVLRQTEKRETAEVAETMKKKKTTTTSAMPKDEAFAPSASVGQMELESLIKSGGFGKKRKKSNKKKTTTVQQQQQQQEEKKDTATTEGEETGDVHSSSSAPASSRRDETTVLSREGGHKTLSRRERKLLELRQRMNVGRKQNIAEAKKEYLRLSDPAAHKKRMRNQAIEQYKEKMTAEMLARGDTAATSYLDDTAEKAARKGERKGTRSAAFGIERHNSDAVRRSYEKDVQRAMKRRRKKGVLLDTTTTTTTTTSPAALDLLAEDIKELEAKRVQARVDKGRGDAALVDFINARNERFNAKAARHYDKYTTEIRQSLERGTAL
eukprot:g1150.t1